MLEKYLTFSDLMVRLNSSRSTVRRRVADGTLPAPIVMGHLKRFKESEVKDALSRLAKNRSQ
ncbi:helix-turn-helix transcriptional regulator [Leisingera sp. ANG-DT]|uniref:helix-turn-helix transcriptional regulator n=1 Tax=Leisingera sp. ANG-DT TaxID=1577897 RepID=UPI00057D3392|nr:excisionase family DNA-binding protein [Leisingera sp. ANG-DT]KIC18507.1 hypothetical protein RA21_04420 [Leisingera sp. ANG-DT]